jgi:hypothetical protein
MYSTSLSKWSNIYTKRAAFTPNLRKLNMHATLPERQDDKPWKNRHEHASRASCSNRWICHPYGQTFCCFPLLQSIFPSHHLSFSTFRSMPSSGASKVVRNLSCKF